MYLDLKISMIFIVQISPRPKSFTLRTGGGTSPSSQDFFLALPLDICFLRPIRRKKGGADQGDPGGFVGFGRIPLQLYFYELHVCSTVASYRIYLQKY